MKTKSLKSGAMIASTLAMVGASLFIPTQAALAATPANPAAQASVELKYDGTGFGTPNATFVNTENGFFPGDDNAHDGVVSSGDIVGYDVTVDIAAGNARDVTVAFQIPEWLEFVPGQNPNLCVSNTFVTSGKPVVSNGGNTVTCTYKAKQGQPVTVGSELRLQARDTAGTAKYDQVLSVTTARGTDAAYYTAYADDVTVVSAPSADLVIRPSKCAEAGFCTNYNSSESEGSFIIFTEKLGREGYATTKGATDQTPWTATVDVSGFPAGTSWSWEGSALAVNNGLVQIPESVGRGSLSWSVPENWGITDCTEGVTEDFLVQMLVPNSAFSTADYLNNGDGWEPGQDEASTYSTLNNRGTGSRAGYRVANNDWGLARVVKPVPVEESIFAKQLFRPWTNNQTLWEDGNKYWNDAESRREIYPPWHKDQAKTPWFYVDAGTELETVLTISSQSAEIGSGNNSQIVMTGDYWDVANQKIDTTFAPQIKSPDGGVFVGPHIIQYYMGSNPTGAILRSLSDDGWISTPAPPAGASAIRVKFPVGSLPIGTNANAGDYTLTFRNVVNSPFSDPMPPSITNTFSGSINGAGSGYSRSVYPATVDTRLEVKLTSSLGDLPLDRDDSVIVYTVSPEIRDLKSSVEPVMGELEIDLPACVTDATFTNEHYTLVSWTPGNCETGDSGKMIVRTSGDGWVPANMSNGTSKLPDLKIETQVSLLAAGELNASVEWGITYDPQPLTASAGVTNIAEPIITIANRITTSTPKVEINEILRYQATVMSKSEGEAHPSSSVIIMPGKGDDAAFLETLQSQTSDPYSGAENSNFSGSYTVKSVAVDTSNSVEGTTLQCTTKTNPTLDPNQPDANWSVCAGSTLANATAIRVNQPGGDNAGISQVNIELTPTGNERGDNYLMWIGGVHADNKVSNLAWPANDVVVASDIMGFVYWDTTGTGADHDELSVGIDSAVVILKKGGDTLATTVTDENGYYEFLGYHSGEYTTTVVRSEEVGSVNGSATGSGDNAGVPVIVKSNFSSPDITVKNTWSYERQRMTNAKDTSTTINLGVDDKKNNVNFGYFAPDPYNDLMKSASRADCPEDSTVCNVSWDVTVSTGSYETPDFSKPIGSNVPITNGVLTDSTSSSVYDVEAIIGERVKQVSAGNGHSLAVTDDGQVYAWGYNNDGQLGDGTTGRKSVPTEITSLSNVKQVSAGYNHSFAVTDDGRVYAWGANYYGQLGDGTTVGKHVPTEITSLSNVKQVSAGNGHSLAVTDDGRVYAWGYNTYGQLGDGTTVNKNVPTEITSLSNVKQVSAGDYDSLAVTEDGRVYAWGRNNYGQLGDGTTENKNVPTEITGLSNVKQVSAGGYHSLAVTEDGQVYAWGWNLSGQLGDGTTVDKTVPTEITSLSNVKQVSAGYNHSFAVTDDGRVYAWGANYYGQLGDGTTVGKHVPTEITSLSNVKQVSAGNGHSLAVTDDGRVYAWGYNTYGQLGDGTTVNKNVPTQTFEPWRDSQIILSPSAVAHGTGSDSLFTTRTYRIPNLQPGEQVTVTLTGKVNRAAYPNGFTIGNQASFSSQQVPRSNPELPNPALPAFNAGDPYAYGKWTGNAGCTATDDWVMPGDACDQVYASIPPTDEPLGSLSGNVWLSANGDGSFNASDDTVLENVSVNLYKGTNGEGTLVGQTSTDADGYYLFENLPVGDDYYVSFNASNQTTLTNELINKSLAFVSDKVNVPTVDRNFANSSGVTTPNQSVVANTTTENMNGALMLVNASISVVKGSPETEGGAVLRPIVNDAELGEHQVSFTFTNNGSEALGELTFSDETIEGPSVTNWACRLTTAPVGPVTVTESDGVYSLPEEFVLAPEGVVRCDGELLLEGTEYEEVRHEDLVTVNGIGQISGSPVKDDAPFEITTSVTPMPEPAITVEKGIYTPAAGFTPEKWEKDATLTVGFTKTISFRVTNTGEENLLDPTLTDVTVEGPDSVKDLTCQWPTIQVNGVTRNILYSSPAKPAVNDGVDAVNSVICTGELTLTTTNETHMNEVTAYGVGQISGQLTQDDDAFSAHGESPVLPVLPLLGGDGAKWSLIVGGLLVAIVLTYQYVNGRRKDKMDLVIK